MTCENSLKLKISYKHQKVTDNLRKKVMRKDKEHQVTILHRKSYIEKCLDVFNTKQFHNLQNDPTKTVERKMQQTLRKIKCLLDEKEYKGI